MRRDLSERRKRMLKAYHRDGLTGELVRGLSSEYGVSESAIYTDWNRRDTWLPDLIQLNDAQLVLNETFAELNHVKNASWTIYETSNNDSARVGALNQISKVNMKQIETLQSVGIIEKTPEKHEFTSETYRKYGLALEVLTRFILQLNPGKEDQAMDAVKELLEIIERGIYCGTPEDNIVTHTLNRGSALGEKLCKESTA